VLLEDDARGSRPIAALGGGSGMGRTRKKPMTMGSAVPNARRRRSEEVSPANATRDVAEKTNAERPYPDITSPVAVPR
jgi:hypothetical protein